MKMSIGFDVSKETVDVAFFDGKMMEHFQVENSKMGFEQVYKKTRKGDLEEQVLTMEATGVYHQRLAEFFYKKGYIVSIVNPLIVKRYADMKMMRAKTDKVDSQLIAQYGFYEKPFPYKEISKNRQKIKAFLNAIDDLQQTKIQNKNRLEALSHQANKMKEVEKIYKDINNHIDEQIKQIEKKVRILSKDENMEEYQNLLSIPGIGQRVASAVIGHFGALEDFTSAKQVVSFIGTNPSPRTSGSSVRGRGSISRKGNRYLRKLFYMAALSASKYNTDCIRLYKRMLDKGKDKMVALIAVANKLIRQVFAIVKYNRGYDPNFLSAN
jgi:transposase